MNAVESVYNEVAGVLITSFIYAGIGYKSYITGNNKEEIRSCV